MQVRAHARLGRILEVPVTSVAHVHQRRKRTSDCGGHLGRGRDAVQVIDGRVQETDVRRVLGLDVMVVVVRKVVAGTGCDAVAEVEKARSGSDGMFR